jgi:hypothetical protein
MTCGVAHRSHRWLAAHIQRPSRRALSTIPIATSRAPVDLESFRRDAFVPGRPLFLSGYAGHDKNKLPAATGWFELDNGPRQLNQSVGRFSDWSFQYELVVPSSQSQQAMAAFHKRLLSRSDTMSQILADILEPVMKEGGSQTFHQIYAPFRLLEEAVEFNTTCRADDVPPLQLYIAQSSLSDLPEPMRDDLPTPEIVLRAGKGDIYGSSIWLGTEPTYTPLHRDPNPNLFCQLCGTKVLRLLPPVFGEKLFSQVQARIRQNANSRIRTVEMMEGKERLELHSAVWKSDELVESLHEVEVKPGDALYIPKGWWHSVKSGGSQGELNGSVNWWFR